MRITVALALVALLVSCQNDEREPPTSEFSVFEVPAHFPDPVYDFDGNPITEEGFNLGRKLFYDKRLSRGSQVSCGSCHAQVHAFADHAVPLSVGVDGREGKRNSPGLYNLAWTEAFMWDGGINHIEVMPIAPITDSAEMDIALADLLDYLQNETEYPQEFGEAFGSTEISTSNLLKALAQFQGAIVSDGSRYDQYIKGLYIPTEAQLRGMALFEANCSGCHGGILQTDFSYRNNGLDADFTDLGRGRVTQNSADNGKFRVPSLRNVALTNPYMHDGRFFTLEQVLDHYSEGIVESGTLDPALTNGIPLTENEKEDIIEFLYTLSDFELLGDLRFSEPAK
ncbi:MAG TPA: cytochrome c peroxidase [Cryomorphaceae bacterium]|nr:cytochrome c peroxidase [Cryomorphaceae bacterium]